MPSDARLISRTFRSCLLKKKGPDKLFIPAATDHERPNGTKIGGRIFSGRAVNVWQRMRNKSNLKNWLVTTDGRGWMATYTHDEVLDDDKVVVLRGLEENPAVLRKAKTATIGGDSCYEFVGLLIERIPLAEGKWERGWEQVLERENHNWEMITLV